MKKLLLLFTIFIYLVSCNSGDETKTETINTDSTINDTTIKLLTPPTRDISEYLIDNTTAMDIQKHKPLFPKTPNYIDSTLKVALQNKYPTGVITSYKGKYRSNDEKRYASTRGMLPGSDSAKVKNYKTVIFKVVYTKLEKEEVTEYYDFVTICPPPDGANCISEIKSSTSSKK